MTPAELGPPGRTELDEPRRPERPRQRAVLDGPALPDMRAERVEPAGASHQLRHVVDAEEVDIQIAGRRGDVSEPPELGTHPVSETVGQDVTQQLQHRPGTTHGDPELVQILRVDVGDDARRRCPRSRRDSRVTRPRRRDPRPGCAACRSVRCRMGPGRAWPRAPRTRYRESLTAACRGSGAAPPSPRPPRTRAVDRPAPGAGSRRSCGACTDPSRHLTRATVFASSLSTAKLLQRSWLVANGSRARTQTASRITSRTGPSGMLEMSAGQPIEPAGCSTRELPRWATSWPELGTNARSIPPLRSRQSAVSR